MRRTLVALLFTLGLSACGGVVEDDVSALNHFPGCEYTQEGGGQCQNSLVCCRTNPSYYLQCIPRDLCPAEADASDGVSSMGVCGGHEQKCCANNVCDYGLECDLYRGKCLYF